MTAQDGQAPRPKARRGFAAMSPEKRRELQSRGGTNAQARGTGHRFDRESARAASLRAKELREAREAEAAADEPAREGGKP